MPQNKNTLKKSSAKSTVKKSASRKKNNISEMRSESDGAFFLKIVLYLIMSSFWVRIESADGLSVLPIPVGVVIALFYAFHDHFQIDRKIELALILVAGFISLWLPVGLYLSI